MGDAAALHRAYPVPDDADALDLIPAPDAVDVTYLTTVRVDVPDDASPEDLDYQTRRVLEAVDGLTAASLDRVVSVRTAEGGMAGAAVGSFDQLESGETVEESGDWRVAETRRVVTASVDGHVAFAGATETGTEFVSAAVEAVSGDADDIRDADDQAATTYDVLRDRKLAYYIPDDSRGGFRDFEGVEALAAGFDQNPNQVEDTAENTYLLFTTDDANLDDAAVERIVTELEPAQIADLEIERDDTYVLARTVAEVPPQYDREAAPSARIRSTVEDATITFEHAKGESIDAEHLELWVEGELADDQPGNEFDTFAPGDRFSAPIDPVTTVTLRWFDEEVNAYYPYAQRLVGEDAFETSYDFDGERLTITYTGDRPADPSNLVLRRRSRDASRPSTRPFFDAEELTGGDAVTVEDVSIGDTVTVELDVPDRAHSTRTTLVRHRARAPRVYVGRDVGETVLYFGGPEDTDAETLRVLVDGDPADRQFADEYDTLTRGDELRLQAPPIGSEIVVEWTRPDEPVEVARDIVVPRGHFDTAYDDGAGRLTLTYEEGDVVDAADLTVRVDGEPADSQPADEYDTVEPGDELRVAAPPFARVEVAWTGVEDAEHTLERTITTSDAFAATYDAAAEAVELTYRGRQPADPARIDVITRYNRRDDEGGPTVFEEAHDTLTRGDSVRVSDVGLDDWVAVVLATDEGRGYRPLFHYTPLPSHAFDVDDAEDGVVVRYRSAVARDAEDFRVLVDGDPAATQPSDVHDTLRRGDQVDLGGLSGGTEVVVEWTALDEPRAVEEHVVVPSVSFSFERSDDGQAVTVEHAGGPTVDAENLVVLVHPADRMRRHDAWSNAHDEVSEGDSVTVETDGDRPIKLAGVQVSDGDVLDYERFDG